MADENQVAEDPFTPEERATLDSLEEKWGEIWPFRVKGFGLVVLRKPTKPEYRSYQRERANPKTDDVIVEENLRRLCLAHPGGKAYDEIIAAFPALGDVFSNRIGALASGMAADGSEAVQDLGKDWKKPVATP